MKTESNNVLAGWPLIQRGRFPALCRVMDETLARDAAALVWHEARGMHGKAPELVRIVEEEMVLGGRRVIGWELHWGALEKSRFDYWRARIVSWARQRGHLQRRVI